MVDFNHVGLPKELPDLIEKTSSTGFRTYETPDGNLYPSVTTVISNVLTSIGIDQWKKKIGQDKADQILKQASHRGIEFMN